VILLPRVSVLLYCFYFVFAFALAISFSLASDTDSECEEVQEQLTVVLPEQFRATFRITQHLIDDYDHSDSKSGSHSSSYPPKETVIKLAYDAANSRARAEFLAGQQIGKVYFLFYKQQHEYMIIKHDTSRRARCERSFLLESMPEISFPKSEQLRRRTTTETETETYHASHGLDVSKKEIEDWIHEDGDQNSVFGFIRNHIYVEAETKNEGGGKMGIPVAVVSENAHVNGTVTLVTTYRVEDLEKVDLFDESDFQIEKFGYTHNDCEFISGGFPYFSALYTYLTF